MIGGQKLAGRALDLRERDVGDDIGLRRDGLGLLDGLGRCGVDLGLGRRLGGRLDCRGLLGGLGSGLAPPLNGLSDGAAERAGPRVPP